MGNERWSYEEAAKARAIPRGAFALLGAFARLHHAGGRSRKTLV